MNTGVQIVSGMFSSALLDFPSRTLEAGFIQPDHCLNICTSANLITMEIKMQQKAGNDLLPFNDRLSLQNEMSHGGGPSENYLCPAHALLIPLSTPSLVAGSVSHLESSKF